MKRLVAKVMSYLFDVTIKEDNVVEVGNEYVLDRMKKLVVDKFEENSELGLVRMVVRVLEYWDGEWCEEDSVDCILEVSGEIVSCEVI